MRRPAARWSCCAAAVLAAGEIDAALVVGSPASVPEPLVGALTRLPSIAIGPRASAASFEPAVAVDTGVAGIHEGGTAFRMDDVPLPLRDRKSTRLNSSHSQISYAVFCLKKK